MTTIPRRDYAHGLLTETQVELVRPTRPLEYRFDLAEDPAHRGGVGVFETHASTGNDQRGPLL